MNARLRQRLQQLLAIVDDHDTAGPRLSGDARRLWRRVQQFAALGLADIAGNKDAVELACYALQLPLRQARALPAGRLGRTSLKDRAEQAAELLVSSLAGETDEVLLDRTTRILHELPQRSPMLDEAKLLADAINLDDFGAAGLLMLTLQLGRQGDGIEQVLAACQKREEYGYWEARLRDGFHFEPVRKIAEQRLGHWRDMAAVLEREIEDKE